MNGWDPRQQGRDDYQEGDVDGLGQRQKEQNAKRDRMHASALRRNRELERQKRQQQQQQRRKK